MNRTLRIEKLAVEPVRVSRGEALIATALSHPVRGRVQCPAAALFAGSMRRLGLTVRYADFTGTRAGAEIGPGPDRATPTDLHNRAQILSFKLRDGRALGLGVVTAAGADEDEATASWAMAQWAMVLRTRLLMTVSTQESCVGAISAAAMLEHARDAAADPVFVLGDLPAARRGAISVASADEVPEGARVLIGAAGVGAAERDRADARGLRVLDATCPLVAAVHGEIRRFVAQGDQVVLVGRQGHAAVAGLIGQAPESVVLAQNAAEAATAEVRDPRRVAVVLQPGLPLAESGAVAEVVRSRFGHVIPQHPSTYCYAATDRQTELAALAATCNVVLVTGPLPGPRPNPDDPGIGSADQAHCAAHYRISGPEDVRPEWLAGAGTVGVVAGNGAGPRQVEEVIGALSGLGPHTVARHSGSTRGADAAGAAQRVAQATDVASFG